MGIMQPLLWSDWRFPMRAHCFQLALLLAFTTGAYGQASSNKYTTDWLKSYGKYVEIAGATRAGAEVCATCHAEDSMAYSCLLYTSRCV